MHRHSRFDFLIPQAGFDNDRADWAKSVLLSVLVGSSFWFCPGLARAETLPELLAQQVVDGLPPPPSLPSALPIAPVQPPGVTERNVPPSFSDSVRPIRPESQPARPTTQIAPPPIESGYAVYVNGDSPLLLGQVRQIESGAFLQTHGSEQVIQAGLFREKASAIEQVSNLESQGIEAEVVEVSYNATSNPASTPELMAASNVAPIIPDSPSDRTTSDQLAATPSIEFGQQPPSLSQSGFSNNSEPVSAGRHSYYVVVPGRTSNLPDISSLVTLLGAGLDLSENNNQERSSPLGPHVLVGPFTSRTTANRWTRYFRDFGMDARVYYKR